MLVMSGYGAPSMIPVLQEPRVVLLDPLVNNAAPILSLLLPSNSLRTRTLTQTFTITKERG